MQEIQITRTNPVPDEQIRANVASALERGLPELDCMHPEIEGPYSICGSGPSIKTQFDEIRQRQTIVAAGSSYRVLREAGITPHACVVIDPLPEVAAFFSETTDETTFYVASQCHPGVFDALKDRYVVMWHAAVGVDLPKPAMKFRLGGGSTVVLRAWNVGYVLGYRQFEWFGFDACLDNGQFHMLEQYNTLEAQLGDPVMLVQAHGRMFVSTPTLLAMAQDYEEQSRKFGHLYRATVHGDGMVAWLDQQRRTLNGLPIAGSRDQVLDGVQAAGG